MNSEIKYDVFLSYNSFDREAVDALAEKLRAKDLSVFLDDRELRPGLPVQKGLSYGLEKAKSVAVVVGPNGIGPWQEAEIEDAISDQIRSGRPVIPVLLPGASADQVPRLLRRENRIDFGTRPEKEELARLYWGITGIKPTELGTEQATSQVRPPVGATMAERAANTLRTLLRSTNITFLVGARIRSQGPGFPPNDIEITSSLLKQAGLITGPEDSPRLPIDTAASYYAVQYNVVDLEGHVWEMTAQRSKRIPPVHQSLARFLKLLQQRQRPRGVSRNPQLIVTTNPDVIIERALLSMGIAFTRVVQNVNSGMLRFNKYFSFVATPDDLTFPGFGRIRIGEPWDDLDNIIENYGVSEQDLNPMDFSFETVNGNGGSDSNQRAEAAPVLYKLRGSYDCHGTCALSIEQYLKFYMRPIVPRKITEIVQQTPIVLLNYGYLDPDYRLASYTLLEKARETTRDPIFAVQTVEGNSWPDQVLWDRLKATALEDRKITTIEEDGEQFLGRLIIALQPLAAAG